MSRAQVRRHAIFAGLTIALFLIVPRPADARPGDIDPTFGRHGSTLLTFGNPYAQGSAIAYVGPKIVVAGTTGVSADTADQIAVARLTGKGKLDRSFSDDGATTVAVGAPVEVRAVKLDSAGRILVGGSSQGDLLAVRLTPDGDLDTSFSGDGFARMPVGGAATGGDLILDASGAPTVGGTVCETSGDCEFAVARFTPGGDPAVGFSDDGLVTTSFPGGYAALRSISSGPGNTLVAAGLTQGGLYSGPDTAIARYLSDGSLDASLSGGGRAVISDFTSGARQISVDSEGRILLLGESGIFLRRLASGEADTSFGSQYTYSARGGGFAFDSSGRILVGGSSGGCSRGCSAINTTLDRRTPTGAADTSFGTYTGTAFFDLGSKDDGARAVAADESERPLLVGFSGDRMVVARAEAADGPPDRDGDKVDDRADSCGLLFGPRPTGCPKVTPKLTLRLRKRADLWVGTATSPQQRCSPKQTIQIFRKRSGADLALTETTPADDGSFEANGNLTPGAYYAQAKRISKPALGVCRTARSNEVRIRG